MRKFVAFLIIILALTATADARGRFLGRLFQRQGHSTAAATAPAADTSDEPKPAVKQPAPPPAVKDPIVDARLKKAAPAAPPSVAAPGLHDLQQLIPNYNDPKSFPRKAPLEAP